MEPVFISHIPQRYLGNERVTFTDLSPLSKLQTVENTASAIKHNFTEVSLRSVEF